MISKGLQVAVAKGYSVTPEGQLLNPAGVPMSPYRSHGYLAFNVIHKRTHLRVFVHRLQAVQKCGGRVATGKVTFTDGDRTNCAAHNVVLEGLGSVGPVTRRRIRESYRWGESIVGLARQYGLNRGTVWRILNVGLSGDTLQRAW